MIYIPCHHKQQHNGGWVEEQHFLITGRPERVAIAPCMLLCPTSGRVCSWLETLSSILHRRIVHERVLRRLLWSRYGPYSDLRSVGDLLLGLPVFYRYHSDRYFLLRDVIPYLPRIHKRHRSRTPGTIALADPVQGRAAEQACTRMSCHSSESLRNFEGKMIAAG
jgi:hypothetical protein